MHNDNSNEYIPETYIPHVESNGTKEIWRTLILYFISLCLRLADLEILHLYF